MSVAREPLATATRWWIGWGPLLLLPLAATVTVPPTWPRWAFMWVLAAAVYAGCKWLTWRMTPVPEARLGRHLGYLLAWPGMDAAAFLNSHPARAPGKPTAKEWVSAGSKIAAGLALIFGLARRVPADHSHLVGWVGMTGIVIVLHFGAFHLLSCAWRHAGVDAKPLMNWPLCAVSVSEFWGRRWNTAFRDLTHRFLFRPLAARFGPRWALWSGFLFSGVVHDLVISLPAGGGYGGPTLFFALQAAAIFVERHPLGRRLGLGSGLQGWLFAMVVLVVPAPVLFHPPFVNEVVIPFLRAFGAIP